MGPPPFGGGKWYGMDPDLRCDALASMGPPPFGGGKDAGLGDTNAEHHRFNGATSFRRWKAGRAAGPRRDAELCFNGATSFRRWKAPEATPETDSIVGLQWGHLLSAVESCDHIRLAVAVHVLQWGHLLSAVESALDVGLSPHHGDASMGPPPFGGGKLLDGRLHRFPNLGFNGATSFRRGERSQQRRVLLLHHHASMGPPPFGGGKSWNRSRNPSGWRCFNGATSFRRWKERGVVTATRLGSGLQWGHLLSAVESSSSG